MNRPEAPFDTPVQGIGATLLAYGLAIGSEATFGASSSITMALWIVGLAVGLATLWTVAVSDSDSTAEGDA